MPLFVYTAEQGRVYPFVFTAEHRPLEASKGVVQEFDKAPDPFWAAVPKNDVEAKDVKRQSGDK